MNFFAAYGVSKLALAGAIAATAALPAATALAATVAIVVGVTCVCTVATNCMKKYIYGQAGIRLIRALML